MKLSYLAGSGFLAMVIAMPPAMAADGNQAQIKEQRLEQYMEQTKENREMHMEKHQNRYQVNEENKAQYKDIFQNRLREKQDSGFRMKSGSGGRR
jgi:hypothetical protein